MLSMDRRVPESLTASLQNDGVLHGVLRFVFEDRSVRDLQLRALLGDAAAGRGTASVYVGMSAVLSVDVSQRGLRFQTHQSYRGRAPVNLPWNEWLDEETVSGTARHVEAFLEWSASAVDERWIRKEGRVHAALAAHDGGTFMPVNREVSVGFDSTPERDLWTASVLAEMEARLHGDSGVATKGRFGTGLDILGVDRRGRVLAIEAKPAGAAAGIRRGPLQVWVYAQMMRDWATQQADAPAVISGMAQQRHRLGLCEPALDPHLPVLIVPVLAIGEGKVNSRALADARSLGERLSSGSGTGIEPMELWLLGEHGRVESLEVLS
ncbi:MAG: hypothetical protein OEW30_13650 [Acidimicrobiia bacterium]|nr:hypothetical protein [Acidimicrobiia bacterium]